MIKVKYLVVGENKDDVYFLGYKLKLSPSEYKLILAIAERGCAHIELLAAALELDIEKRGNVAVHICSVNRKAEIIGGRKLILCKNSEYYFNELM